MLKYLQDFVDEIRTGEVEIYNEFSLQHELGIYLRNNLPGYKVQFERNVKMFNMFGTIKREIDIVVYDNSKKIAIELKFPRNGQYPEQMYSFIKDIRFMEELKQKDFCDTYCMTFVDDQNFYSGTKKDGIYSYFRAGNIICGTINKPTGKEKQSITLSKEYKIEWEKCNDMRYYITHI